MAKKRLGILGGSFDPIHTGHLILAEHIKQEAALDQVIFIPAWIPPHKADIDQADAWLRYHMVKLAVEGNPGFSVSDLELQQKEVSYTIHTLRSLQSKMGTDHKLYFITGADTILDIEKWYHFEELLSEFSLLAGVRPGYLDESLVHHIRTLSERYGADIQLIDIPKIEISSTDIRDRVRRDASIRYLVPQKVLEYINLENLYSHGHTNE